MSRSKWFKAVAIAVLLVGIVLAFSACGGGGDDVVGKWKDAATGDIYDFQSGGKMTLTNSLVGEVACTYEVKDGTLSITMTDYNQTVSAPYTIEGSTMTISPAGEDVVTLERQ